MRLKAPFPFFGGKSRVAHLVWERFGDCANYVEPFAGSLAVLLARPGGGQIETVNDIDCFIANFWRALARDPGGVARWADWPVNEADLHARHRWLVHREKFRERMKTEPWYFDVKIAGWWVWGISQWIGSGWCVHPEWTGRTNAGRRSRGITRQLPHLGTSGTGIHRKRPVIHGTHAGLGIHAKRANLSGHGSGVGVHAERSIGRPIPATAGGHSGWGRGVHSRERAALGEYFAALAERLRRVRVCCGNWRRVLGDSVTVKNGISAVFLDPPYDLRVVKSKREGSDGAAPSDGLYSAHDNGISAEVRAWAIEHGDNPGMRIALCGYEGEHTMPDSWECIAWKAHGGYGNQSGNRNRERERIWFSPGCLRPGLAFDGVLEVA